MSKVRVSNGSPPLERVDARQADSTRPPVCRNLFGSADPEELGRDAREQMREMEDASRERWNFDFAKNEPLVRGKYEWQEVDGKDIPEFYTRPHHVIRATSAVDHNGNHDFLPPTLENGGSESAERDSDFSTPRKRASTEDPPCRSKRPNSVQSTDAKAPGQSDPKT